MSTAPRDLLDPKDYEGGIDVDDSGFTESDLSDSPEPFVTETQG